MKIVKMAKIFNRHRKFTITKEWFQKEKYLQAQTKDLLRDLTFDTKAQTENVSGPIKRLQTQKSKIMKKQQSVQ